jgi:spermidine synthase
VNGKIVASDGPEDLAIELLLGHAPALLHPNPKSALVVGLGAGGTLGSVAAHQGIEEIVLVEIEPAVFGGAALFRHVNRDVLNDPRLEVVIQDGRNFLKTTPRQFDVITADPIHPWNAGAVYLYTREYYELASRHLSEEGVMCQWVPLTEMTIANFRSLVRTFSDSFEYTTVWDTEGDVALIGSHQPFRVQMERWAERISAPAVKEHLDLVEFGSPVAFLSRLSAEDASIRVWARDGIVNTDDNLHIEFSSPLALGTMCEWYGICGLAVYYPGRIQLVSDWAPFFPSAAEGTAAIHVLREDHFKADRKKSHRRTRRRVRALLEQEEEGDAGAPGLSMPR